MKRMEVNEKIFNLQVRKNFEKNKTLRDAYDSFNDLYKIETGRDYNV